MDWKKGSALFFFLLLVSFFIISCDKAGGGTIDFSDVWDTIVKIGTLEYLLQYGGMSSSDALVAIMRILVAILVFAIFYELSNIPPVGTFNRNSRIVVAIILAIMSAIFIPKEILTGIGAAYGTLVSLVLVGVPVVGGLYLFFRIPHEETWQVFLRVVILVILLWILLAVKTHASGIMGV